MRTIRVAVAGIGAFGAKHLDALKLIDGVEVVSLIGGDSGETLEAARRYGVAHATTKLEESLALSQVEAVILCTPTPLHAAQAIQCMIAGKHVQVEIPLGDRIADVEAVAALQASTGLVAMCGHTRQFNPSHQWVHRKIVQGEFALQHLDAQTYFFRRTNKNALGQPRSWTDHLLWHHAAHTVDLFIHQSQGGIVAAHAMQGPVHPDLGIPMDMSIQLKSSSGALCTLALSFNNKGPLGSVFRYIGDSGTYVARYDELVDGEGAAIDVSGVAPSLNGIELQDREFLAAIREGREPQASVQRVLPCYRVLATLEESLGGSRAHNLPP
jgi:2-hydroxy-4-carboxymuconate semialdehyde hemiacetal dehydrogenase